MKHPRVDPCVTFFNRFKPVEREARLDDDDDDEEEEEEEDGIYRRERGVKKKKKKKTAFTDASAVLARSIQRGHSIRTDRRERGGGGRDGVGRCRRRKPAWRKRRYY